MKETKDQPEVNKPLTKSSNTFPVVGVGASAGGLNAFKSLLKAIPDNSGMAYVLVQHLSPSQESLLPDLLQKVTNIPVLEITDDINVEPDHIYIIPANKMLMANDGVLQLSPRPAPGKDQRNLPIDIFFSSLAEVHQSHSIGVVLSGTASDGTTGLKSIKDHGGITFAQDEESAEYKEMPRSAVHAGVVDFILSPEKIPEKLLEIAKIATENGIDGQSVPQAEPDAFKQILSLLRVRKGTDFTYYKQTTIRRRMLRRMVLNNKEEPLDYLKYLRENKTEQDALYQDLLIPVTSFFRDTQSFEQLCAAVLPKIITGKMPIAIGTDEVIRIWVAGCSTGEEAYSMAICLKELSAGKHLKVQIFATDISEPAIAKARSGIYTKSEMEGVGPERLREFFTKTNGNYQVNKELRDTCVFAVHNFLKDPPFGRVDLVTCRNVLIYMEPYLQKKALGTFHYALNPKGFLFLGKSESISPVPELFAALHKSDKLFSRKDAPDRIAMPVISQPGERNFREQGITAKKETLRTDFQRTADDIILSKYTPAGVVVNEMMDIVHFRGNTSDFLQQPAGKPSHNLLKLAKNGLAFELRNVLHKVKNGQGATRKENQMVTKENIPLMINGSQQTIAIEAISLPNVAEPHYLILFHHTPSAGNKPVDKDNKNTTHGKLSASDRDLHLRIQQLEQELEHTHEDMRGIADDQEAAYEELQSANEELESGSEELRSLNEELETSKEELQSTNEELTVVNQQLTGLNQQITEERNYAEAVVTTVREPLLVLDKNLRIKAANQSFFKTFLVNEQETDGKRIYDLGNNQWDIPELRTLLERVLPEKENFSDFEVNHNFPSIGQRTMLLNAREIQRDNGAEKLILLAIEDVTEIRKAIQRDAMLSAIVDSSDDAIISKTLDGTITSWNNGAEKIFGYSANEAIGKNVSMLIPPALQQEEEMVIANIKKGKAVVHFETLRLTKNGAKVNISLTVSPVKDKAGKITGASKIARDITGQIEVRKKIEDTNKRYHNMLMHSPFAFSVLKGKKMEITLANDLIKEIWGKGDQVEGKTLLEVLPELKDQPFPDMIDSVYATGNPVSANEILARFNYNGKIVDRYFNVVYYPHLEADETISGVVTIANEVTNQVLARKRIEESEKKFRSLIEEAPVATCLFTGREMKIEVANEIMIGYWGKGKTVIGKRLGQALPELKDQPFLQILEDVFATGKTYEAKAARAELEIDGVMGTYYFDFIYKPLFNAAGEVYGIMDMAVDVTEQVLARKKIEESEYRYHNMIYTSPSLISIFKGEDMIIEIANDAILESWGKGKDIIGKSVFEAIPETVEQGFDKMLLSVYKTGEPVHAYETPITLVRHGKPELMHYTFIYQAQRNADGEIEGVAVIANEVTPQVLAKKKLEESEQRFRNLVEKAPHPICILKGEDMILNVANEMVFKIWNVDKEAIGKRYLEIIPEMKDQPFMGWLLDVYHNGVTHYGKESPAYFIRKTGEKQTVYFDFVYQPYHEDDGGISGVMVLATDVTEQVLSRKKIEESEHRYREMIYSSTSLIAVLKGEDNIISIANDAIIEIWGKGKEVIGKPFLEALPELAAQNVAEELRNVYTTGIPSRADERPVNIVRHGKMELRYYSYVFQAQRNAAGAIEGIAIIGYEVTDQVIAKNKNIEGQELRAKELEEKVLQRTLELSGANAELTKMNKELESFNYISSHDLQEPLRKIQTFTTRIEDIEGNNLSAKGLDYFQRVKDSAHRMQTLIQDLLSYSRTVNAEKQFKKTDIRKVVEEVVDDLKEIIQEKNATIETHLSCESRIIPFQFHQAIYNLVSNSLKFSEREKRPHIIIKDEIASGTQFQNQKPALEGRLIPEMEYCHITISDNGIGFEQKYKDKIFEVFQRLFAKDEYLGTGIGLSIVKKIVENHNGVILATGEINKGATFDIYIPSS